MQLTVTTVNGDVFTVEVAQDMEVENLLALCQVEVPSLANVPAERLLLLHNGRTLNKGGQDLKKTIQEIALSDNDMVLVSAASANTAPAGAGGRTGATAALGSSNPLAGIDFSSIRVPQQRGGAASASTAPRPSANANPNDPAVVYQQLLNDAPLRAQLRETNPALSEALESGNF
uniref:Ubiquitin-like domain-containing protein n=1 Tax=Plectus sambesii TaxID=2011161 RepID=A0A914URM6_9BILA